METPKHSKNQQVVDMELSKTSFDVDLDEVDTDIQWLKSVPSADFEDHRLKKKPGQSVHICDICQKSFKGKHNLVVHLRAHKGIPDMIWTPEILYMKGLTYCTWIIVSTNRIIGGILCMKDILLDYCTKQNTVRKHVQ